MSPSRHRRATRLRRDRRDGPPTLEGFTDLVELGRGGFASVYRAIEAGTDRPVALKVLDVAGVHPHLIEAFYGEMRTLATVSSHPNIVTLYRGVAGADGRPVLVLELCRGSYAQRVGAMGPLPAAEVVSVGIKMAGALETAHRAGFLHRDVKPQNILVTQFGEPALADFGLAVLQASAESADQVLRFSTLYAPPEVLEGGGLSPSTDVYGLASTLYQLLTGAPPFTAYEGQSPAAVILRVLHEAAPPITRTDVPLALSDLIMVALAKDPTKRPSTAATVADGLRQIELASGWAPTPYLVWGDEPAKASRDQPGPLAAPVTSFEPRPAPNSALPPPATTINVGTPPGRAPAVVSPPVSPRRVLRPAAPSSSALAPPPDLPPGPPELTPRPDLSPGPPELAPRPALPSGPLELAPRPDLPPGLAPPPGLPPGVASPAPLPSGLAAASSEPDGDERRRRTSPRRVPSGGPARPTVADMPWPDVAFSAMPSAAGPSAAGPSSARPAEEKDAPMGGSGPAAALTHPIAFEGPENGPAGASFFEPASIPPAPPDPARAPGAPPVASFFEPASIPAAPPDPTRAPGAPPVATAPGPERPFRPTLGAPRPFAAPTNHPSPAPAATTWAVVHEPRLRQTADPTFEVSDRPAGTPEQAEGANGPAGLMARRASLVMGILAGATIAIVIVVLILAGVF